VHILLKNVQNGNSLADHVIFYRVHAQSRVLEDTLRRNRIPYKIIGGVRFYDRREIKDLTAYLRIIANPTDDVSLRRIMNVPSRGVGKKSMEIFDAYAREKEVSLFEAIRNDKVLQNIAPKARRSLEKFAALIVRAMNEVRNSTVSDLLRVVLDGSGYVEMLQAEKNIEAQSRIENIEEFFSVIQDFEDDHGRDEMNENNLESFLETVSLTTELDNANAGNDALMLMTLHTAKGLEFPIAFMIGMEEGIFPNANAFTKSEREVEEERRLCYVGITRAKTQLTMTYARERLLYGTRQRNLPSRFLNEIPDELYESNYRVKSDNAFGDSMDDVIMDYNEDSFISNHSKEPGVFFD